MAKYTRDSHITTVEEVKDFFRHIVFDLDINFHPDNDFADYISFESKTPSFSEKDAVYNRVMDESFDICETAGADIYELALDELQTVLDPIKARSVSAIKVKRCGN